MSQARERISRGWLAAIFVVALVLRVVCVAQYESSHPLSTRPVIDEESYDHWAREIAGGELVGKQIFFQEPLYPYVLGGVYALVGDDVATQRSVARYGQAALGALTAALVALLAARLFSARAGILAGFAFALHRPAIWFATLLLKENLFSPVLVGLALALVATRDASSPKRERWLWLLVGVLAAVGALLRGNLLVMLPFVVAWPLARSRTRTTLVASAAVVAGIALVLTPVALRNLAVGGRFVLTTSGAGTNFYGGNNFDNPYGVATEFPWVRGIPEHEADDWRHEASRRAGRELDATETSSFWLAAALESMREHPLEHAWILANKLRLTLGRYEVPDNHFLEWDARFVPLLEWPWPGFALSGVFAVAGALLFVVDRIARRADARERGAALEVLVLAGLYLATIVLTVTSERIRLPLFALLLPFAGFVVDELVRAFGEPKRWLALAPAFGLASALVLIHVLPPDKRGTDFDERDYNLAVRLLNEGDLAGAEPLVRGLEQKHASSAPTLLLAADLESRQARAALANWNGTSRMPDGPAAKLQSALTRLDNVARRGDAKSRYRAQVLSGAIHEFLGQWSPAEDDFRAALAFDAEDRDLRRRLAHVIAEQAMQTPPGPQRTTRLRESLDILDRLLAERRDPDVERLFERIRKQL